MLGFVCFKIPFALIFFSYFFAKSFMLLMQFVSVTALHCPLAKHCPGNKFNKCKNVAYVHQQQQKKRTKRGKTPCFGANICTSIVKSSIICSVVADLLVNFYYWFSFCSLAQRLSKRRRKSTSNRKKKREYLSWATDMTLFIRAYNVSREKKREIQYHFHVGVSFGQRRWLYKNG